MSVWKHNRSERSADVIAERHRPFSRPPALSVCSHWPFAALSFSVQALPARPVASAASLAASAVTRGVELDGRPSAA